MEKTCSNCKFESYGITDKPCDTCFGDYNDSGWRSSIEDWDDILQEEGFKAGYEKAMGELRRDLEDLKETDKQHAILASNRIDDLTEVLREFLLEKPLTQYTRKKLLKKLSGEKDYDDGYVDGAEDMAKKMEKDMIKIENDSKPETSDRQTDWDKRLRHKDHGEYRLECVECGATFHSDNVLNTHILVRREDLQWLYTFAISRSWHEGNKRLKNKLDLIKEKYLSEEKHEMSSL